jgi:hypothetical protein
MLWLSFFVESIVYWPGPGIFYSFSFLPLPKRSVAELKQELIDLTGMMDWI